MAQPELLGSAMSMSALGRMNNRKTFGHGCTQDYRGGTRSTAWIDLAFGSGATMAFMGISAAIARRKGPA